jgi:hypothetical protein
MDTRPEGYTKTPASSVEEEPGSWLSVTSTGRVVRVWWVLWRPGPVQRRPTSSARRILALELAVDQGQIPTP